MMALLSKDEFIACLCRIDSAAYTQAYIEKAVAHDQAQRVVIESYDKCHQEIAKRLGYKDDESLTRHSFILDKIEQQAKEIEQWKAAAQMHNGVYEPLQQENKTLREALESYATCTDGCTCGDGWSHDTAQQALKEVSW